MTEIRVSQNYNIDDIESIGFQSGAVSFLQKKAAEVRMRSIIWKSYQQSSMITQDEYNFIVKYISASNAEVRRSIINENPAITARMFLTLLNRINLSTTTEYVLTLIDDMLQEDKTRVNIFKEYLEKKNESVWPHFFGFLLRGEPFIINQASRIISKIACWSTKLMEEKDLIYYLNWLREQLKLNSNDYIQTVARNLQMMLRIKPYRKAFVINGGLEDISMVLKRKLDAQIRYQLVFCLWCVSFDKDLIEALYMQKLVPILSDIMCETTKEKVMRIICAFFREMLEKLDDRDRVREVSLSMVHCKVLKQIELYQQKKLDHDPELEDDLKYLAETLNSNLQDVSTLEEYVTELKSGRLNWSPAHNMEKFWRENAHQFNEKNYELLKILVKILETSRDTTVLSVAAHDIGEYVRYYPRGKIAVENLGGKTLVMSLLKHDDLNVKYNALISLQKIMIQNWEYLGKQLDAGN